MPFVLVKFLCVHQSKHVHVCYLGGGLGLVFIFYFFLSVKIPNVNSSMYITKYLEGLLYLTVMITLFLKLNIFVIPHIFISLWKWVSLVETFTHLNDKDSLPLPQCITLLLKLPSNTLHLKRHSNPARGSIVCEEIQAQRGSRIFAWWHTGWKGNGIYSNINKRCVFLCDTLLGAGMQNSLKPMCQRQGRSQKGDKSGMLSSTVDHREQRNGARKSTE